MSILLHFVALLLLFLNVHIFTFGSNLVSSRFCKEKQPVCTPPVCPPRDSNTLRESNTFEKHVLPPCQLQTLGKDVLAEKVVAPKKLFMSES